MLFFLLDGFKDGSWNCMISAHASGQIFADLVICPYCFMSKESIHVECYIFSPLTLLLPKFAFKIGR